MPRERREQLLDEFEKSGLTGQKFAALSGVKYQTFATWAQKRRRARMNGTSVSAQPNLTLNYSFDEGSEATQQVFSASGEYTRALNYSYDNIGQLTAAQGSENSGATPRLQEQFGYAYDKAGNLNERTNNALIQSFAVNDVNELSSASHSGTLTVAGTTTEPGSDVTSVSVNGQAADVYGDGTFAATGFTPTTGQNTYTAIAQDYLSPPRLSTNSITVTLSSGSTYSNGNLLSDGARNFAYDDENQLVGVWEANSWSNSFAYDGLMRKRIEQNFAWNGSVWTETNEVHYIYDGNLVLQERDQNNQPLTTYTRGVDLSGTLQGAGGIGGLLARSDNQKIVPAILTPQSPTPQNLVTSYYFSDSQGNVTALVSPAGMLLAQYEYDPFGNLISKSGLMADVNKYRFSSKEWDDNAGLYYYGFRFYDPNLQRWVNRDPIGELGGINLYDIVANNTINQIDELGLWTFNIRVGLEWLGVDLTVGNTSEGHFGFGLGWAPGAHLQGTLDPNGHINQGLDLNATAGISESLFDIEHAGGEVFAGAHFGPYEQSGAPCEKGVHFGEDVEFEAAKLFDVGEEGAGSFGTSGTHAKFSPVATVGLGFSVGGTLGFSYGLK